MSSKSSGRELSAGFNLLEDDIDGSREPFVFVSPDGGAVIDTKTKKVAARIPTSEKLLEVDFQNGKAVKAGHR